MLTRELYFVSGTEVDGAANQKERISGLTEPIDQRILLKQSRSDYARSLLKWLLSMPAEIGCTTVVESVESAGDARIALSLGARWLQGFHIAEPRDPASATLAGQANDR